MLGKVMKYEWKDASRLLLPLYGILLIVSLVARLNVQRVMRYTESSLAGNYQDPMSWFSSLIIGMYVLMIVACGIVTVVFLFYRFYLSMYRDEGYLTQTLPLKSMTLLTGKILMNFIWYVVMAVAMLLSLLLLFVNGQAIQVFMEDFNELMRELSLSNVPIGLYVLSFVCCSLVAGLFFIIKIDLCLSMGQLTNKHRKLVAVLTFVGLYLVNQIVSVILLGGSGFFNFMITMQYTEQSIFDWLFLNYMPLNALIEVVLGVIYFMIMKVIVENKLNLE